MQNQWVEGVVVDKRRWKDNLYSLAIEAPMGDFVAGQFTQLALEGQFANGNADGLWTAWHENGQMKSQGNYNGGDMCGHWTFWDEQGNITSELDYDPCP